ncbi:hypothetical protein [Spirosoma jeollabukense]
MKTYVLLLVTFLAASSSIWVYPEQFGDGRAMACPVLKQTVEKFATFTSGSDLSPIRGQKDSEPIWLRVTNSRQPQSVTPID